MWVETRLELRKNKKTIYKKVGVFKCDYCEKIYEARVIPRTETKDKLTFCTKECYLNAERTGIVNVKRKKTLLVRYGNENYRNAKKISETWSSKSQEELGDIQRKMKQTTKERHGKETYRNVELCKETKKERYGDPHYNNQEQNKKTTKELYGDENYRNTEKAIETSQQKYGVTHVMKLKEVKDKAQKTYIENNGGLGFASKSVYENFKKTMFETYGVDHPMKSDEIKSKVDWKEWFRKMHETMKKNGSYGSMSSKTENAFYELLASYFSVDAIDRFVNVNNHIVDFYIKQLNTYIQFDGEYWHGLDRPLEEVKKNAEISRRAKGIYTGYFKDREQDKWFAEHNIKLVRITDKDFNNALKNNNFDIIIEKIRG